MKVTLNNKNYTFLKEYQKENRYRLSLDQLVEKIFGISLESWYQTGYWNEQYIPYTLFDGNQAIANVSISIIDFLILGEKKRLIQLGAVLTDERYRNRHLNTCLMERVLEEWKDKCDFIYLFANKTVLEFYPKFGFERVKEYEYFKFVKSSSKANTAEKLNMDIQSNREKLYDYAKNSVIFSKVAMRSYVDLIMFYAISSLKNNIYYVKSLDAIVVATYEHNQLHLLDIFSKNQIDLDSIISSLVNPNIKQVILGFTPLDCCSYEMREHHGDDALFIQMNKTKLFDDNQLMFPLLSHA